MPTEPPSQPGDPRQELTAYARLLARLARPFADRDAELSAVHLTEAEMIDLQARWVRTLERDESLRPTFEKAYVDQLECLRKPLQPPSITGPDETEVPLGLPLSVDPDETLPISGPVLEAPANPFRPGEYRPPPPLARSRPSHRDPDDPDATRLPVFNVETLPFNAPSPPSPADPRKKR